MAINTLFFGLILVALGLLGYIATDAASMTALIPAIFGVGLVICGVLAFKQARRMMAMHIAVLIGLIGFLAALGRLIPTLIKGGGSVASLTSLAMMGLVCGLFVVLCVRSFIAARKNRQASQPAN